jgi:hypothetical protein
MARKGRPSKARPQITLAGTIMVEIDNPNFQRVHAGTSANPRKIMAAYNPRESYVSWLFAKSLISEAERRAGDKVRKSFEAMGGAGAQAIDYSRTKVDGGKPQEQIAVYQLEAGKVLQDCCQALGPQGHDLVIKLCGEGRWPKDLANDKKRQDFISLRLRECLGSLASHWGFQTRVTAYRKGIIPLRQVD